MPEVKQLVTKNEFKGFPTEGSEMASLAQKGCHMPRTTPRAILRPFPNRRQPSDPHLLQRRPRPRIQTLPILLSSVWGARLLRGRIMLCRRCNLKLQDAVSGLHALRHSFEAAKV